MSRSCSRSHSWTIFSLSSSTPPGDREASYSIAFNNPLGRVGGEMLLPCSTDLVHSTCSISREPSSAILTNETMGSLPTHGWANLLSLKRMALLSQTNKFSFAFWT